MKTYDIFSRYRDAVASHSQSDGTCGPLPKNLLLSEEGDFSIYYAPFDYVNDGAKLVIVGITPGLKQARLALDSAASTLRSGATTEHVLREAKNHASFGGPMRTNLVQMMDCLGINSLLGIHSTSDLFTSRSDLVHFTSILRYPVFVNDKNYSGSPHPSKVRLLNDALSYFQDETKQLQDALFLPVGTLPNNILARFVKAGHLDEDNVLLNIPHPSGANQERINYFLGKKPREALSSRTNPEKIDVSKMALMSKLSQRGIHSA